MKKTPKPKSTQSDSKSFALEEEEREVAANARCCQWDVGSPGEPPSSEGGQEDTAARLLLTLEHSQLLSPVKRSVLTVPTYQTNFIATT